MHTLIDSESQTLTFGEETVSLYSDRAFEYLSTLWLKVGWNQRYHYTFTWAGRPVLQLPEDLLRIQEVIVSVQPTLIIETGIALGGSLLFYASLCKALDRGRVIGIDCDLHPPNRKALEEHVLASYLTLIDGDSTSPATLEEVSTHVKPIDKVLVILDSNHSKDHVLKELTLFAPLVSSSSYLIVADGFKRHLADTPRGKPTWTEDNPAAAVTTFLKEHSAFSLKPPLPLYNRTHFHSFLTHFTQGWLWKK